LRSETHLLEYANESWNFDAPPSGGKHKQVAGTFRNVLSLELYCRVPRIYNVKILNYVRSLRGKLGQILAFVSLLGYN
jgi:hypothetical protein